MYYDMCPTLLNKAKERQAAQDWQQAFLVGFNLFNLIQYTARPRGRRRAAGGRRRAGSARAADGGRV